MTSRLRSILGGSNRVKKKRSTTKASSSSSWSNSLPRTKSGVSPSSSGARKRKSDMQHDKEEDFFQDDNDSHNNKNEFSSPSSSSALSPLPDEGLVHALATDLTLRDVPQAMRYSRDRMFTPIPDQHSRLGLGSTRVAEELRFRAALPPLVTTAHLHALLRSPTAVERETAELIRAGTVRKVVVWRRGLLVGSADGDARRRGGRHGVAAAAAGGGVVEFLIEGLELERLVRTSGALGQETREAFLEWLRANPAKIKVSTLAGNTDKRDDAGGREGLKPEHVDQLVRGGFLTTYHDFDIGNVSSSFARPEDRGTMLSLESISRAAAGSVEAVGGYGAIHGSGGSGRARGGSSSGGQKGGGGGGGGGGGFSLAVPGQGAYLKLLSAAVSHLSSILAKASSHREMPETLLRERWDGGIASEASKQHARKRERKEFAGVWASRTKKWKQHHGVAFEWVLHEAVGLGQLEVFETGSVGRGIRLL